MHVGIIMDGNRRYAAKNGLSLLDSYIKGAEKLLEVSKYLYSKGVKYLTFYALSMENLDREEPELQIIYKTFETMLDKILKEPSIETEIKFIGRILLMPENIRAKMAQVEKLYRGYPNKLFIAIAYAGRYEIIDALVAYMEDELKDASSNLLLSLEHKLAKLFGEGPTNLPKYLYLDYTSIPYPDLIIRTGNVKRLSNFLLYEAAYSELYFLECMWPELTTDDLDKVLDDYTEVKKNWGK